MAKLTIKRPTITVDLCMDLEKYSEWQAAQQELIEARAANTETPVPGKPQRAKFLNSPVGKLERRVAELEDAMAADVIQFKLQALSRKRWQEVEESNPPREDNQADERFGLNIATFLDDALPASVVSVTDKASGEPVEFDPEQDWDDLADSMTDGQFQQIVLAVLSVNRATTDAPFSPGVSRTIRGSAPNSKQPAGSASRTSDSSDGSPAPSTSTTTTAG